MGYSQALRQQFRDAQLGHGVVLEPIEDGIGGALVVHGRTTGYYDDVKDGAGRLWVLRGRGFVGTSTSSSTGNPSVRRPNASDR